MALPILPINTLPTSLLGGGPNLLSGGLVALGLLPPQWGIFSAKGGRSVVSFDTVMNFDYRRDWNMAKFPLERGAFESYDKVQTPFVVRLMMSTGSSFAARQKFIQSIRAIEDDMKLYDVITPEETLYNCNVEHVDYHRGDGLAGIVSVSVFLQQINVSTQATLSSSSPSGSAIQNGGQVQATTIPTQSESLGQVQGGQQITNPTSSESLAQVQAGQSVGTAPATADYPIFYSSGPSPAH